MHLSIKIPTVTKTLKAMPSALHTLSHMPYHVVTDTSFYPQLLNRLLHMTACAFVIICSAIS